MRIEVVLLSGQSVTVEGTSQLTVNALRRIAQDQLKASETLQESQ